jgi:hypothetical protein
LKAIARLTIPGDDYVEVIFPSELLRGVKVVNPVSRQILATYAFFEQSKDSAGSTSQSLVPFILPYIAGKGGTAFTSEELSVPLSAVFGSEAAKPIADSMLDPLIAAGYLKRDASIKSDAVYFYTDLANAIPIDASISTAEHDLDDIIVVLRDYISLTSFIEPLAFQTSDLRTYFVDWVTTLELSELRQSENDTSFSNTFTTKETDQLVLLFSSFVRWAAKENNVIFNKISRFTELGLMIDLLSELRVPTRKIKNVSLTVVLDSRLLLELLGLYGTLSQNSIKRLLELCRKYGVSVATLVHLVDEVREITYNAINNPELAGTDSVNDAMRMHPEVKKIIRSVHAAPDALIRKEGITIFPYKQLHDRNAENFFTTSDVEKFAKALPYDKSKPNMARRDAWSLAYAVRRQNGAHTSIVYESKCVIVTRSPRFVSTARDFLQRDCGYPKYAVIPVIEFRHFSTMFMLAFGLDATRPVVRSELVAVCDRVIRVSPALTQRIRSIMSQWKQVPSDQIEAALEDPILLSELALATSNDPSSVTVSNGKAIYEIFRSAGARDAEMRHLEEERMLKEQHERELQTLRNESEQKQWEVDGLKLELFNQSEQLARINASIETRTESDANIAFYEIIGRVKIYWRGVIILIATLCLLLMLDTIFHFTDLTSFTEKSTTGSIVAKILAGILGLLVAYHTLIMVVPRFGPERFRVWLTNKVAERRLSRYSDNEIRDRVRLRLAQHMVDW